MQRNYRFLSGIFLRTDMIEDIEMGRFQTRGVHYENLDGRSPALFSPHSRTAHTQQWAEAAITVLTASTAGEAECMRAPPLQR